MMKHTPRRIFLTLAALLLILPVGWVSQSAAQVSPQAPPAAPGAGGMQQIEGKIASVDRSSRTVTLDDGTQLTIPSAASVRWEFLQEGAIVKASYEEQGGQKMVTSMEVAPSKQ
ncbi:MAG: DUF1344 domain-containing protein [Candidatus Methylomirabilales bacterium]